MKKKIILFILLSFFSCKNEKKAANTIKINPSSEYVYASDVFNDFEITPLEGNEKGIIAEITKMEVTPTTIYVLDCKQMKLLLFSNSGKYLNSINNIGKGPDEYITLDDFIIHQNKILLLSRVSKKILQYSLNGFFEKTIRLDKQYTQLANGSDGLLVFFRDFSSSSNKDLFNIELFDLAKEKVINKYSPFQEKQNGELCFGANRNVFASNKNELYLTLPLQHKIIQVDKDGLMPFLDIDFGKGNELPEGIEDFTYEEALKIKKSMIYNLQHVNISDNYIYFSFVYNFLNQNTIINRKNNRIISGYLVADDKIPFSLRENLILKNNTIITYVNPEDMSSEFYKDKLSRIKAKGYLITDLLKNNNPILIKLKLK